MIFNGVWEAIFFGVLQGGLHLIGYNLFFEYELDICFHIDISGIHCLFCNRYVCYCYFVNLKKICCSTCIGKLAVWVYFLPYLFIYSLHLNQYSFFVTVACANFILTFETYIIQLILATIIPRYIIIVTTYM